LENDPNKVAILYGPLVLAGDLGAAPETKSFPYAKNQGENFRAPVADVPVLVHRDGGSADFLASIKRIPGKELAFRTEGIGRPGDVTLRPFYSIFYQRYNVYWDVLSEQDWTARQAEMQAAKEQRQREEARIVDVLNPGEQQSEVDHRLASDRSQTGDFRDRKWRDARDGGYFEFQMKVLRDSTPQILRCTYFGDDAGREFDILADGKLLATEKLNRNKPGKFFDAEYPFPPDLITGKEKITVRFQPHAQSVAGGLFSAAVLKAAP
jgi:hypothetical protein